MSRARRAVVVTLAAVVAMGSVGQAADVAEDAIDVAPPPHLDAALSALRSFLGAAAVDGGSAEDPVTAEDPATAEAVSSMVAARLPACEYRDQRTRYHKVKHWRKTLLDTNLRLGRKYEPWDLVSVSRADIKGSGKVRRIVIKDLRAMARAARRAGKPLAVRSAYRSYQTQVAVFNSWVRRSGYQQALKFSARPGHSEHQLGTTIDFTTAPGVPLSSSFGTSGPGKWIARNGWKFGFIMPYPKGMKKVSCYGYEPWHWRYVGRELARKIHESGQVPRRYYWQNFETAP